MSGGHRIKLTLAPREQRMKGRRQIDFRELRTPDMPCKKGTSQSSSPVKSAFFRNVRPVPAFIHGRADSTRARH